MCADLAEYRSFSGSLLTGLASVPKGNKVPVRAPCAPSRATSERPSTPGTPQQAASLGTSKVRNQDYELSNAMDAIQPIQRELLAVIDVVRAIDTRDYERELERCLLYTSPSPRDLSTSRMPSSA